MEQIQLFLDSCRSAETRKTYSILLSKYIDFVGENNLFCANNPRLIEAHIIKFIMKLRDEDKPSTTIVNYLNSIKAFYRINDVVLNIYKISKLMPEHIKANRDRAYTHSEISKLLEISDERMKVVILLMASSGARMGALSNLRIRNLEGNKLTIYENTKEEYFTFITPETRKTIDNYLEFRKRYGEELKPESWLIREQFDLRNPGKPRQIFHKTMQGLLRKMTVKSGIRQNGTKYKRQKVMNTHGFRKFFTTQLINSRTSSEIREMLLGHKIGLASAYYRPTEDEMYYEYEKAIDSLTINEENRLRKKIQTLQVEKSLLEDMASRLEALENKSKLER